LKSLDANSSTCDIITQFFFFQTVAIMYDRIYNTKAAHPRIPATTTGTLSESAASVDAGRSEDIDEVATSSLAVVVVEAFVLAEVSIVVEGVVVVVAEVVIVDVAVTMGVVVVFRSSVLVPTTQYRPS
jgi:hypothetical protein